MTGVMWRTAPAPHSGSVRICGVPAKWATIQQRSQIFSPPMYEGECAVKPSSLVSVYDFKLEERCQEWSPNAIYKPRKALLTKWNDPQGPCEPEENSFKKLICLSFYYIESQKAGFVNSTNPVVPFRGSSTLKDGCDVTDRIGAPKPADLSGGYFIDDGHVKVTQVIASVVSSLATAIAANFEAFEQSNIVDKTLEVISHGLDFLDEARIEGSDIVVQVGDARVDERCENSIESSAEKRATLRSTRKYPATDVLGATSGAFFAASAAFQVAGDDARYRMYSKKGKNLFKTMLNSPKGLSVENEDFSAGEIAVGWTSTCFEDEVAWATTWACSFEKDEKVKNLCFEESEKLLEIAENKCPKEEFGLLWSWNDVRAGARFMLARHQPNNAKNLKIFTRHLNTISEKRDDICPDSSKTGNAASILALGTTLKNIDDETRAIWRKSVRQLINCTKKNIIGLSRQEDLTAKWHKNSLTAEAKLWGGILSDKLGHTSLATSVNFLVAAAYQ